MRLLTTAFALLSVIAVRSASDTRLTGVVSDFTCGADHHGRAPAECVRTCTSESIEYALVVRSKVYMLVGDEEIRAQLSEVAGEIATVAGDLGRGDVIAVTSVTPFR